LVRKEQDQSGGSRLVRASVLKLKFLQMAKAIFTIKSGSGYDDRPEE
jgi:hypothetical protein